MQRCARKCGCEKMDNDRLFLGYKTAFWIWRKAGPIAFSALSPSRVRSLAGGAPTRAKVQSFLRNHPDLATKELDVIARYGDQRKLTGTRTHIYTKPLPDRSFYRLDDDVFVASPELCLMQLASKLSEAQAVKLAMEMCGSYAIDVYSEDEGMCKRPAITSRSKLIAYADRLYSPGSRAKATHFLRWVVDASASPRETALCILLCLPPRFGGYGFPLPELNKRIDLSYAEQLMVGAHHFDCDVYWKSPKHDVAIEYDSSRYHSAMEKQERDAIRRNMLEYKKVRVITATRLQVNSMSQFDKFARQTARAIGKRLRIPEQQHIAERAALRETLFSRDVLKEQANGESHLRDDTFS